ncbi:PREDICTED: uncharacterized protein LOC104805052 [Tarenaya hassleriana]|uniref:uncharacterized protein LOC104805052 n=1 Tax=Tarenaya hassleriana TaxID=28532 RepID=UPI00053C7700|nr:PREDICTED: uncharacterized protein LOC104805052 [Tarenaya hassleriana]
MILSLRWIFFIRIGDSEDISDRENHKVESEGEDYEYGLEDYITEEEDDEKDSEEDEEGNDTIRLLFGIFLVSNLKITEGINNFLVCAPHEGSLEHRFLLQKAFASSNRLPPEPVKFQ